MDVPLLARAHEREPAGAGDAAVEVPAVAGNALAEVGVASSAHASVGGGAALTVPPRVAVAEEGEDGVLSE